MLNTVILFLIIISIYDLIGNSDQEISLTSFSLFLKLIITLGPISRFDGKQTQII